MADSSLRSAARGLARIGYRPLPVAPGQKHPLLSWTKYRDRYDVLSLASEWRPGRGLWSMLGGAVGRVCLDNDNQAAIELWRRRLGDETFDGTARVKTRKGKHLHFTVPIGTECPSWTWKADPEAVQLGAHYELLADKRGVMLPPSPYPDAPDEGCYEWEIGPEHALAAPAVLLTPPDTATGGPETDSGAPGTGQATSGARRSRKSRGGGQRSILARQLTHLPDAGGRNDWHAIVSGHLVRLVPYSDAYEALALLINSALPEPLPDEEVLKTWRYRWDKEQAERTGRLGDQESGWLSGDGSRLFTVVKQITKARDPDTGAAEQSVQVPGPWANADLIADGVIESESGQRTYVVRVARSDGLVHPDLIEPGLLGSATDTSRWLASHGVSVVAPKGEAVGRAGHAGQRILRYLESQKPAHYTGASYLGWNDAIDGFVTHEGVLTAAGLSPHEGVMPDPQLRKFAPYHYGMGDLDVAVRILREVLTFQDAAVAAVFGAWWAATHLKGQIMERIGHFPYMQISAASEAGKTRGIFRLLSRLAGSTQYGIGTKASMRDYIGAHRNGIVHIDDPDSVEHLSELLRSATGEAIVAKKARDNLHTIETRMVAPILLSGEAIGTGGEKAQRDRCIQLDVPSPIGRMSTRDPTRPQIDDIKALERAYPDLTEFAGTLVVAFLSRAPMLDDPRIGLRAMRGGAGRSNEIKAILRTSARILADLLESDGKGSAAWIVREVDAWCDAQADLGAANTLLTRVLPWALSDRRWRASTTANGAPPAYLDEREQLWVSVERLAGEWQRECRSRGITDRLSSEEAIRAQLKAMGASSSVSKRILLGGGTERLENRRMRYHLVPDEYARQVIDKGDD